MTTTKLNVQVSEGSTPTYRALIVDDMSNPIPLPALQSLKLTICESQGSRGIINSCLATNILNADRGSYFDPPQLDQNGNSYNLSVLLQSADTMMLNPKVDFELRSLIVEWVYNLGKSLEKHEAQFPITPIRPG